MDNYDFFISYASEQRDEVAKPLADALRRWGYKVWFDGWSLAPGGRIARTIDHGLAGSRVAVVVASEDYFRKAWTQDELGALRALKDVVIVPVLVRMTSEDLLRSSPLLADHSALRWTKSSPNNVVDRLMDLLASQDDQEAPLAGEWKGATGRLRLFLKQPDVREESDLSGPHDYDPYVGRYDWNHESLVGRLIGRYNCHEAAVRFTWTWTMGDESGLGWLAVSLDGQQLVGGWALGTDASGVDIWRSHLVDIASVCRNRWNFSRLSPLRTTVGYPAYTQQLPSWGRSQAWLLATQVDLMK